ncbi:hypothetical protein Val02_26980 [Virgisporangium aliadipatigenens]|uniref:Uncharacterized protein n=1 Tax=Virgisporangium aliadipatigenens TaxID=741659 RepID=A0A8J3YK07_9ACTN|nr:hypothetical protein [Virgisporangium aliadipatigenens]GIJ45812.1 hypothetical protein Val02_26980 [Virgisporangium aliadipatigenens]
MSSYTIRIGGPHILWVIGPAEGAHATVRRNGEDIASARRITGSPFLLIAPDLSVGDVISTVPEDAWLSVYQHCEGSDTAADWGERVAKSGGRSASGSPSQ